MFKVNFVNENITADVKEGTTVLQAARNVGVIIESPCDAVGTCGKCKVKVDNLNNIICNSVRHKLSVEEQKQNYVLSCQANVYGDISVITLNENQNDTLKILSEGQSFTYDINNYIIKEYKAQKTIVYGGAAILGEEIGDTTAELYGLSVDIGTTTVVTALINMLTGEEISSISALNPQSLHAQDVLTRIKYASDDNGLNVMFTAITEELNNMILKLTKKSSVNPWHIYEVVYSGNTTMVHLGCNVNPESLGKFPYISQVKGGNNVNADMLNISPFGTIYIPPIISAYVGADITSGILASQLAKKTGTTLFIDIGTNGEMVIAKGGHLSATSTAAGPAFEGMNISCGMRAAEGAIEIFDINGDDIDVKTIGDAKPSGICGSGLLDIVGELVSVGVISKNGKFVHPDKGAYSDALKRKIVEKEGKLCFEAAENVYLSQKDIRQVQLAKGAVRAGVEALLLSKNVKAEEVDEVQIAGSFGYHLREKSLINIGLLPKEFEGKISFVGNTSKTGGKAFLLNTDFRDEIKKLVGNIEVVELANKDNFDKLFVGSLNF